MEIDDGNHLGVILGEIFVLNLEAVFDTKNNDIESLTEQVLLLLWIHSVSLVVQSETIEPFVILDCIDEEDGLLVGGILGVTFGKT